MKSRVPVRVLVVDDSAVMRGMLRMTLEACPEVELAGMAADGVSCLEAIETLKPDLVLLDIEMPQLNGLEILRRIPAKNPSLKVIMCSTLTRRGAAITLQALACGAADYVTKPHSAQGLRDSIETLSRELMPKIRALFSLEKDSPGTGTARQITSRMYRHGSSRSAAVVAIGVSTGGPAALERLLPALPAGFPLPVLIVQHMPRLFTAPLAERLDGICPMHVREAISSEAPRPGVVYLAPGDRHMQIVGFAGSSFLRLTHASDGEVCCPSVDTLFRSVADVYGAGSIAIMLTGMGSDGLEGCRAIHVAGGKILAQNRATSVVWGMPGAVVKAGLADEVLPLEAMAEEVVRSASRNTRSKLA